MLALGLLVVVVVFVCRLHHSSVLVFDSARFRAVSTLSPIREWIY